MKVGDKYIIEIGEIIRGYGNNPEVEDLANVSEPIAKIKGFNTLMFNQYGLDKLEQYDETDAQVEHLCGQDFAWNVAKSLFDLDPKELEKIFGEKMWVEDVIRTYSPEEVEEKVKEWLKTKAEEVHVGDVVYFCDPGYPRVVTALEGEGIEKKAIQMTQSGKFCVDSVVDLHKTGKFINLDGLMRILQGGM